MRKRRTFLVYSRLYSLYRNKFLEKALFVCLFLHILVLPLFERPATFDVPFWTPIIFECIFVLVYSLRLVHAKLFQENKDFYGVKKNIIQLVVVVVSNDGRYLTNF
jgi:hypothetical protein